MIDELRTELDTPVTKPRATKTEPKGPFVHVMLTKMLERGIPVKRADFHSAVNNSDNVPENYFSNRSNVPSRNVTMWWINGDGLLCYHKKEYFFVPASTVKEAKFE